MPKVLRLKGQQEVCIRYKVIKMPKEHPCTRIADKINKWKVKVKEKSLSCSDDEALNVRGEILQLQ